MSTPAPRPALRKAADAHIHPAAPSQAPGTLRHAPAGPVEAAPVAVPAPTVSPEASHGRPGANRVPGADVPAAVPHRLSGPLRGTTSDSLRGAGAHSRRGRDDRRREKQVELTVKVPKSLRKEFQAALKADRKDADKVVAALLQAWLHG